MPLEHNPHEFRGFTVFKKKKEKIKCGMFHNLTFILIRSIYELHELLKQQQISQQLPLHISHIYIYYIYLVLPIHKKDFPRVVNPENMTGFSFWHCLQRPTRAMLVKFVRMWHCLFIDGLHLGQRIKTIQEKTIFK